MKRLTLATAFALAVLLMCSSPSRVQAQGDTKITVKDGGSLILHADGLDGGKWSGSIDTDIHHENTSGTLSGLQITSAGNAACAKPMCGVDTTQAWRVYIAYDGGSLMVRSLSGNHGIHIVERKLAGFSKWNKHGTDEREYGAHGDGKHITKIVVNGGANLCPGNGCEVDVSFRPQ